MLFLFQRAHNQKVNFCAEYEIQSESKNIYF